MTVLTVAERQQVWRALMRWWSQRREPVAFSKRDLYDSSANSGAIAETDNWIDAREGNTAPDTTGLNGSLSEPFKTSATASQKSDVFIFVAARRRSVDILKKLFSEVD
jgi:hypothetical protein